MFYHFKLIYLLPGLSPSLSKPLFANSRCLYASQDYATLKLKVLKDHYFLASNDLRLPFGILNRNFPTKTGHHSTNLCKGLARDDSSGKIIERLESSLTRSILISPMRIYILVGLNFFSSFLL